MEDSNAAFGRLGAFQREREEIQRRNLLGICKMCVKSLVDKSAFESINDDCSHLVNLCNVLEHILTHKLQVRWTLFGSGEPVIFWQVIMRFATPVSISSIQDMEEIQTEIGKGRAWIRLSLVQKRLSHFFHQLLNKHNGLKTLYNPGAFMCSELLTELAGTLKCLDAIDFNLCLRGQDFDFGELREIEYSPYLVFRQSRSSVADDGIEAHKLSSPNTDKAKLLSLAGLLPEDPAEIEGESLSQLRESVKTEKEQKNYFEELVSVRDNQLARANADFTVLSDEKEREKKELEDVVLELQRQLNKLQVELRECQHKLKAETNSACVNGSEKRNSKASQNSTRSRAASLFSNLFSD